MAGLRAIYGALIVAGLIGFAIAPFFTRLLRFFPPVVTGVVITVIGVSLLPVADRWALGTANSRAFGSIRNVGLAAATLLIIVLVIMTETTADILAIGEVVDKRLDRRDVTGGLQADMLSTRALPGPWGDRGGRAAAGPRRRRAGAVRHRRGQRHPHPEQVDYEGNANLVIVAATLGMGVIPIAVPTFYEHFPTWFQVIFESGISAAALTAVLLNLLFNYRRGHLEEAPIFAEAPPIGTTFEGDTEGIVTEGDPPHPTHPIHPHRQDAH